MEIELTDDAKSFLVDAGYDPQFGARPMKRVIQNYLVNELSRAVIADEFGENDKIVVDRKENSLTFSKKESNVPVTEVEP
jgi:ATPases with chaperone activity, ATP-binding subunit